MKDAFGHGSDNRGGLTPVQSENAPFVSRLGKAAGHSFLAANDPRGDKRSGIAMSTNARFSGPPAKSGATGKKYVSDIRASQALSQGHPKSRSF